MKTIYRHKKSGKELMKVKEQGNTITLQDLSSQETIQLPRITISKWYEVVETEGTEEVTPIEEVKSVGEEVLETLQSITEESKEEEVTEVTLVEEPTIEVAEEPKAEEPEVAEEPKEVKPKVTRKAKGTDIPEEANKIEKEVEGISVVFYEYQATDSTFKTEAVITCNESTYRLGSIYRVSTQKAFSSFYYKDNSPAELSNVQRKGIKSAAEMLSPVTGIDSAILEQIMKESRQLEIYRQED